MCSESELLARVVLNAASAPGNPKLAELVAAYGPEETLQLIQQNDGDQAWARRARSLDGAAILADAHRFDIRFITPDDAEWPASLADLDGIMPYNQMGGMPVGLWLKGPGNLAQLTQRSVAVVGARASSNYGNRVAGDFSSELAGQELGFTVISGGAYGIDVAAHRAALQVGGHTIAVFAGGLDDLYPKCNSDIFEQILASDVLVSEIAPRWRPTRSGFLARNRLIAAFSQTTLVIEAAYRSGAKNTAAWALELGRLIGAVPGSIYSESSKGCNQLIRDQAAELVGNMTDLLALLARLGQGPKMITRGADRPLDFLPAELLEIREAMPAHSAISPAELAVQTGHSVMAVNAALAELELLGWVANSKYGWRISDPVAS